LKKIQQEAGKLDTKGIEKFFFSKKSGYELYIPNYYFIQKLIDVIKNFLNSDVNLKGA
jgi:hypothetical protein